MAKTQWTTGKVESDKYWASYPEKSPDRIRSIVNEAVSDLDYHLNICKWPIPNNNAKLIFEVCEYGIKAFNRMQNELRELYPELKQTEE